MTEGLYGLNVSWNIRQKALLVRLAAQSNRSRIISGPVAGGVVRRRDCICVHMIPANTVLAHT